MRYLLEIELDNDDLVTEGGDLKEGALASMIREVADAVEDHARPGVGRIVRDWNGNRVGKWKVSDR